MKFSIGEFDKLKPFFIKLRLGKFLHKIRTGKRKKLKRVSTDIMKNLSTVYDPSSSFSSFCYQTFVNLRDSDVVPSIILHYCDKITLKVVTR